MSQILADQPELLALAALAALPASKVAAAFNDTDHLFEHLSLEEIDRIRGACERLGALSALLATSLDSYTEAIRSMADVAAGEPANA